MNIFVAKPWMLGVAVTMALVASAYPQPPARHMGTQQGAQVGAPPASAGGVARPKSSAEGQAYNNAGKLTKDPNSAPDAVEAALTAFVTTYPESELLSGAQYLACAYFNTPGPHQDYDKTLLYCEQSLKSDPRNLLALNTLGDIIPDHVKDTDLDKDQRLSEAEQDDDQAIKLSSDPDQLFNGKKMTDGQRKIMEATAYSSLGRIARTRKQWSSAVEAYTKAVDFDDSIHQAADYYYIGLCQEQLKNWTEAAAAMTKAGQLGGDNPDITKAVAQEQARIKALSASH